MSCIEIGGSDQAAAIAMALRTLAQIVQDLPCLFEREKRAQTKICNRKPQRRPRTDPAHSSFTSNISMHMPSACVSSSLEGSL